MTKSQEVLVSLYFCEINIIMKSVYYLWKIPGGTAWNVFLCVYWQNPPYGRHWISQRAWIIAAIPARHLNKGLCHVSLVMCQVSQVTCHICSGHWPTPVTWLVSLVTCVRQAIPKKSASIWTLSKGDKKNTLHGFL